MIWINSKKKYYKRTEKLKYNSQFDWLVNYIPKPIKNVSEFKDKMLRLYNSKNSKIVCGSRKKLSKPKLQKESKDDIIKT